MNFICRTPRRHRLLGAAFFAANLANILVFPGLLSVSENQGTSFALFAGFVNLATIILLTLAAAYLAHMSVKQRLFIRLMEDNGFIYNSRTGEFTPKK